MILVRLDFLKEPFLLSLIKMKMVCKSIEPINKHAVLFSFVHKLGWWFVNYKGKEGWAPSSYLEPENGTGIITEEELDEVCIQTQEGERERERERVHYCLPL